MQARKIYLLFSILYFSLNFNTFANTVSHLPNENWMAYRTPEEAGFCPERLKEARDFYDSLNSTALFVVYDGAVIASWGETERKYHTHSIRKSFLSALFGIEVEKGTIGLDQTLYELGIDDFKPLSTQEKQANIEDMLTCRSGVYINAAAETSDMSSHRPPRGSHAPGEHWWYNNWSFNALGTIFEKYSGSRIGHRFYEKIAAPIHMEDFHRRDVSYEYRFIRSKHPSYPFRMSSRDMARFGLLYMNGGRWDNRQVIPADWVEKSTSTVTDISGVYNGYGYMWWVRNGKRFAPHDMYAALGMYGHSLFVVPESRIVLVHRVNSDRLFSFRIKEVSQIDQLKLLDMIIKAKVGEPKPNPELVPVSRIAKP